MSKRHWQKQFIKTIEEFEESIANADIYKCSVCHSDNAYHDLDHVQVTSILHSLKDLFFG